MSDATSRASDAGRSIGTGSGQAPGGGQPRRLRADAEANLDKIFAAAEVIFDEYGPAASIELVAQRAGVGLGTIYRRFANKEALLAALVRRLLEQAVIVAERHRDDDSGGLIAYMYDIGELLAAHRGSVARMWSDPGVSDLVARSRDAQAAMLEQAQRQGLVRPDLAGEDIGVALWAVHGILDITRGSLVDAWRRHLDLVIAGWTDTSKQLQHPALTDKQMSDVIRNSPSPTGRA